MILKNNNEVGFIYKNNQNIDKVLNNGNVVFEQGFIRETSGAVPLTTPTLSTGKNLKGYKIYGNSTQKKLPSEYQTVEYIQCVESTTYFDTGVIPNQDTKIDVILETTDIMSTGFWYGCRQSATAIESVQALYYLRTSGDGERFAYGTSNLYKSSNQTIPLKRHIVQDKNKLYLDDELVNTWNYENWTAPCSMCFGALFSTAQKTIYSNSIGTRCKFYSFKIWDNEILVRNYVPCYRKSDNVIGMYDLVNDTFNVNAGSGTFGKGTDVLLPSPTIPIEIENTGDLITDVSDANYGKYKIPVIVKGKNILDKSQSLIQGIGEETPFTAWSSQAFDNEWVINNLKPDTTYSVSYDVECISVPDYDSQASSYAGMTLYSGVSGYSAVSFYITQYLTAGEKEHIERTITTPSTLLDENANYRILAYTNRYLKNNVGVMSTMKFTNIQIEENSDVTSFEPYRTPSKAEIYLNEPLRKLGDYVDYIDFENQKVVRKIYEKELTSAETFLAYAYPNNNFYGFYYITPNNSKMITANKTYGLCNYLNNTPGTARSPIWFGVNNYTIYMSFPDIYNSYDDNASRIAGFKEWLDSVKNNGKSLLLDYILATPTEESITLPIVPSIKGTTIYQIDTEVQPSSMYIKYKGR